MEVSLTSSVLLSVLYYYICTLLLSRLYKNIWLIVCCSVCYRRSLSQYVTRCVIRGQLSQCVAWCVYQDIWLIVCCLV